MEGFYKTQKLQDILDLKLLKKGAFLAKHPDNLSEPLGTEGNRAADTDLPTHKGRTVEKHGTSNGSGNPQPNSHSPAHTSQTVNLLSAEDKILTTIEFAALEREKNGTLSSLTKDLIVTLATCAVGAVVQ